MRAGRHWPVLSQWQRRQWSLKSMTSFIADAISLKMPQCAWCCFWSFIELKNTQKVFCRKVSFQGFADLGSYQLHPNYSYGLNLLFLFIWSSFGYVGRGLNNWKDKKEIEWKNYRFSTMKHQFPLMFHNRKFARLQTWVWRRTNFLL